MFYDPNALQIDPSLLQLARQPEKPVGFWDRLKASNKNNLVMGMQPDEFSMMMGSIGQALMPDDHPIGRLAASVYGMGKMKRDQRLEAQKPENRIAEAKTRALLGEGQPDPTAYGYVAGAPNQTALTLQADPMSVFRTEGDANELLLGPLNRQKLTGDINYTQAGTERMRALTPFEIQQAEANARYQQSQATRSDATLESDIANAKAQAEYNKLQAQYYPQVVQADIEAKRAGTAQGWGALRVSQGNLALGHQQLNENIAQRYTNQATQMNQSFQAQTTDIHQQIMKSIEQNPLKAHTFYQSGGKALIGQSLQHLQSSRPLSKYDGGAGSQVAAQGLSTGIQYMVQGINQSKNINEKTAMTVDLIRQIDLIKQTQPQVGQALERALFSGGGSAISPYTKDGGWFKSDQTFDPLTVYNMTRGIKK